MQITIWSGLILGSVYALVSLGFILAMLPSGVFNFAQGAIVVAGTYFVYTLLDTEGVPLVPAIVLNLLAGVVLGIVCELLTVRTLRLRGRSGGSSQHNELITTVGMSTVIVGLIGVYWGYLPLSVPFDGPTDPVRFLGVVAAPNEIALFLGTIAVAGALHVWFHATRWGQACLATAEDREAATLRGINVDLLSVGGFAVAGALGTVSAFLIGPITYAIPTLAHSLALGGFVAIALGGHGSFLGALYGGLMVGLVATFASRYIGTSYADLSVLALLLLTLMLRPTGLGAAAEARRV